jgi:hypothetical protein
LDNDYETVKHEILYRQILFIRENPSQDFVTSFDYTAGRTNFAIVTVDRYLQPPHLNISGLEQIARATESGDRMELRIMWLGNQAGVENPVLRLFPMRSNISRLYADAELASFPLDTPEQKAQMVENIRRLVDKTVPDMIEFHWRGA